MESNEIVGKNYADMVATDWFSKVYGEVPLEERSYFEYERTMTTSSELDVPPLAIRARQYFLQFEDSPGIMFAILQRAPQRESLNVIQKMTFQTPMPNTA